MKIKFIVIIILALLSPNLLADAPNAPDIQTRLENEGTVCVLAKEDKLLDIYYLPLNKACASSSRNHWLDQHLSASVMPPDRSLTMDLVYPVEDYRLYIQASAVHVRTHDPLESADCAGSGIQVKTLRVNQPSLVVFLGNRPVAAIAAFQGAITCSTLDKAGRVTRVPSLHKDIKLLDQFIPHPK